MIAVDKLCYQSNLRTVSPQIKVVYALLTLSLCVGTRSLCIALVVLVANTFLTVVPGGLSIKRYLGYLTIPLGFLIISTLSIVLNVALEPLDLFALSVGQYYITASYASLEWGIQLMGTSLASVTCLCFLAFSTPMPDILVVLGKLHCPKLLIELMLLIYRGIFVLLELASQIRTAQQARLCQRYYRRDLAAFAAMLSTLFVLAMKQSARLYDAMESRCYQGTLRVLTHHQPAKKREIAGVVLFDGGLLLLWISVQLGG